MDVTDFEYCRRTIYEIVEFSLQRRNKLLADKKISRQEYLDIGDKCEIPLRRLAKNLTIKIFNGTISSMAAYQSEIKTVKDNLKTAIAKIENFSKSIDFFSKVITFFGSILNAASTGIAGIPTLLTNFQAIL
ncbi:hypothetical protein FACHB389_03960 [Nostoc calcicola FACHB-389]|nr:hypothetical protein [Nostoc calcicola FACHB-3891]OKH41660.1 hypothetical protein FACHB389_03960 [Nostoc calcicola FACHB-389]